MTAVCHGHRRQRIIGQRRVIGVEHQRRTAFGMADQIRMIHAAQSLSFGWSELAPRPRRTQGGEGTGPSSLVDHRMPTRRDKPMTAFEELPSRVLRSTGAMIVTRFAPSPTGRLHLGHAYSAALGHAAARERGGQFLVRIEDLDPTRSRPEFVDAIFEDLRWLGLAGTSPCWSSRSAARPMPTRSTRLRERGLVYACFCTRADIAAALSAARGRRRALSRHVPRPSRRSRAPRSDAAQLAARLRQSARPCRPAVGASRTARPPRRPPTSMT